MTMLYVDGERGLVAEMASANLKDVEFGEPIPLDSEFDALDSPIGVEEIKMIAESVTVIATSSTAVAVFLDHLVQLVRRFGSSAKVTTDEGKTVEISPKSEVAEVVAKLSTPAP